MYGFGCMLCAFWFPVVRDMKTLVYFSVTVLRYCVARLDYCKWMGSVTVIFLLFRFCIWFCNLGRRTDLWNAYFNTLFANSECHTEAIIQDLANPDVIFVYRIIDTDVSSLSLIDQIISSVILRSSCRVVWSTDTELHQHIINLSLPISVWLFPLEQLLIFWFIMKCRYFWLWIRRSD